MRWEWIQPEKQRYYRVEVVQDLLGAWVVLQRWGSLLHRQGGHKQVLCTSAADAATKVAAIARRRQYQQYQRVLPGLF